MTFKKNNFLYGKGTLLRIFRRYLQATEVQLADSA